MFHKITWFVFLIAIAVLIGVYFPNGYKIIECSNTDKICRTYNVNSVLKTKTLKNSVRVNSAYGRSWHVMGVGQSNVKHLSCYQQQYTVNRRNGVKEKKVRYLLAPIGKPKPTMLDAINVYSSSTSCEVDRLAIQNYLSSDSNELFVHVVNSSWLRYLWYLVSILFAFLAFLVLFKGRMMSEAEEKQLQTLISEEEYEQMHKGINNIMKHISNADNIGANFINEIENKHDKYRIDIQRDKNL